MIKTGESQNTKLIDFIIESSKGSELSGYLFADMIRVYNLLRIDYLESKLNPVKFKLKKMFNKNAFTESGLDSFLGFSRFREVSIIKEEIGNNTEYKIAMSGIYSDMPFNSGVNLFHFTYVRDIKNPLLFKVTMSDFITGYDKEIAFDVKELDTEKMRAILDKEVEKILLERVNVLYTHLREPVRLFYIENRELFTESTTTIFSDYNRYPREVRKLISDGFKDKEVLDLVDKLMNLFKSESIPRNLYYQETLSLVDELLSYVGSTVDDYCRINSLSLKEKELKVFGTNNFSSYAHILNS